MADKKIQVKLPADLYQDLLEVAEASGWSMQEVVLQAIRSGAPPNLSKVPADFRPELIALHKLNDLDLMKVVDGGLPIEGKLTPRQKKADFAALRRTYALTLLKWRGHPVSTMFEGLITG